MPGRVANIRPGLIVGPEDPTDRFTWWPARLDRGGEVLCPGPQFTPIQYIDARDLAAFIVAIIEDGHVGAFNALGPTYEHTIADLVHACRAATTSDARLTWVEAPFLLQQGVKPWMDMPVWIPDQPGESGGFSRISNAKARSVGLTFRPLADTVRDTLAWSRTRPADHRWGAGLAPDNEQRVLAAWKASRQGSATRPERGS
jgi:2'-hydroxyisoflavone reductase